MLTDIILSNQISILHQERSHLPQEERGDKAPLAWVIGEDVVFVIAVNRQTALMFVEHDEIIDISNQYPEHDGITVQFKKNNVVIDELQTTEYFGSILLSSPKVINLGTHKRGHMVDVPAKFINNDFVVLDPFLNDSPDVWDPFAWHENGECTTDLCQCKK
jgi:hypothetical protein